jgi:glycosyltransferase involved in cell wall biosynthesis
MKVIVIGAQYVGSISGGGGVHVRELTRELGKLGHDVLVLSMGLGDHPKEEEILLEDPHNTYSSEREARIKVVRFWTEDSKNVKSPFAGTKQQEIDRLMEFRKQVLDFLVERDGDEVLHIHGHFVVPAMAKDLKKKTKHKIVNSIHSFESIFSERKKEDDRAGEKLIELMEEMEREAIEHSDCLIVRSEEVKEQISEKFPDAVKKTRIEVVSSGVSSVFIHHPPVAAQELKRIRDKYKISGKLILNVNRIDPSKGIDILLEAYVRFYTDYMQTSAEGDCLSLLIAGMIEEKNRWYCDRLEKIIAGIEDPQIRKSISIHYDIPEQDKIALFDLAGIFVLSSLVEPFGITAVEALAKNVPVVASAVEGPKDIMGLKEVKEPFSPALGGVLVKYDDPNTRVHNLFKGMKYILENPDEIKQLVARGRSKTLAQYSWEALVVKKLEIYKQVQHNVTA